MIGVYEQFSAEDKKIFEQAYSAAFGPAMDICYEIYEVRSEPDISSACLTGPGA